MGPKSSGNVDLTPKYIEGEQILCFHGPLIYKARCLKVEQNEKGVRYFVHYQGWNKNWDEWVSDNSRMMKYDATGLLKQKEIEKIYLKRGKKVKAMRKSELQSFPVDEPLKILDTQVEVAPDSDSNSPPTQAVKTEVKEEPPTVEETIVKRAVEPPPTKRPKIDQPSDPTAAESEPDAPASVNTDEIISRKIQMKFDFPGEN